MDLKYIQLKNIRVTILAILVAIATLMTLQASASSDNADVTSSEDEATKPEAGAEPDRAIIITAQKRVQTIQEVPIAVTNLWAEELEKLRIFDAFELTFHTPGFSAGQFNVGQPQFFIRGIGSNEDGAGGDSAVVVNVDGVPVGRAAGSLFDFFDLERIEVLRGPQGTLYGRNATGGVINVISKLPQAEPTNVVQLGLGDDGIIDGKAYFSGALDDEHLASLSLTHRQRDGVVTSVYGPEQSDINDSGIKAQLYSPESTLGSWRLIGEYNWIRRAAPGRHAVGGAIGAAIEQAAPELVNNPYVNMSPFDAFQNRDTYGLTFLLDKELPWGYFNSITGYRQTAIQSSVDLFGLSEQEGLLAAVFGSGLAGTNDVDEKSWQFSQELRLSKQKGDWFWLSGVFYFHEDVDRTEMFNYNPDSFSFQDNATNSLALFGETTRTLNNEWAVTVGGRFSWEEKQVVQSAIRGLIGINEDYKINGQKSWNKFTPRLVLNYAPSQSLHSYLSVSSGFKSGGFQGQAPTALAAKTPFNEENVLSYELGLKWQSPQSGAKLFAALFHMTYEDLQVQQLMADPDDPDDVGVLITANAAYATSQGIELEWQLSVAENWTIGGNYTYLDATFDRFVSAQGDFAGNQLRNAPRHAVGVAIDYQTVLANDAELNITYSHSYKDLRYQDPTNTENIAIPAHQLANLNVSYRPNNSAWQLGFWLDNVWDKAYFVHGFSVLGTGLLTPAPDRNAGVRIIVEF